MNKYCIIGDLHFHKYTDYSKKLFVSWDDEAQRYVKAGEESAERVMNSRLFYLLSALTDVRDYMHDNDIHLLLNAGDTFHKRAVIDVETFNAVAQVFSTFSKYNIAIISIAGNHDQSTLGDDAETSIHTLASDDHMIIEQPQIVNPWTEMTVEDVPDVNIVCIPWSKDKKSTMDFIKGHMWQLKQEDTPAVLLMHCGITGGKIGSGNYTISDEYNLPQLHTDEFKYAHFGHYHKSQLLSHNAHYTGSLLANDFGDEGSVQGVWVADLDKRYDLRLMPFEGYPKFITVTADNVKELDDTTLKENYVRVQVTADDSDKVMKKLSKLSGDNDDLNDVRVEIEKDYSADTRSSVSITQSTEEILKRYVDETASEDLDHKRLLEVGLSIVSKIGGEL